MTRRAVFLDRDGTIVVERGQPLRAPADVRLLAGAGAAIRRFNVAGFAACVITNQAGIARGEFDEADLARIHDELRRRLARHGARLDAIYHCPHHPEGRIAAYRLACDCRKPAPGLLRRAIADLGVDATASFVVGDDVRDLALADTLPVAPVLVRTGKGRRVEAQARERFGARLLVAANLAAAAELILDREPLRGTSASSAGRPP